MFLQAFGKARNGINKRPLAVFSIFLILGILTAYKSGSILLVTLTIVLMAFLCTVAIRRDSSLVFGLIGAFIFYSFGSIEFLYMSKSNEARFEQYVGKQVTITGYIVSEPDVKDMRVNYTIKIQSIHSEGAHRQMDGKVLLSTLNDKSGAIYPYGRQIRASGKLNIAKGVRNPGGFDYKRYLAQSGISATVFATKNNIKLGEESQGNILATSGFALRDSIVNVINRSLPAEQAALLNGMLIGYREGLSESVQEAFGNAGLTHIMAVSGANIAFIVIPLVFLLRRLGLAQRSTNTIVIGMLIIFIFITGFSPSVVRAVIMAVVILIGGILYRETDIYTSLAFAAILMLVHNPYTLFDIGFQLSFAATLSLVLFYGTIKEAITCKYIPSLVADVIACTLAAQVGVIPISTLYFNKVSVISLLSNILVVPATQMITVVGLIMAALGHLNILFSQIIGYINLTLLTFILYTTKLTSNLPFAVIRVATPSLFTIFIYYGSVLFFLWIKPRYKIRLKPAYCAAIYSMVLAIMLVGELSPKGLEVAFLDVGQGDCALVRTAAGKTVLIDGGGREGKSPDDPGIGETIVIPFLLDYGVSKLDVVIATHGHEDHIQGLVPILEDFNVNNLAIPDNPGRESEFSELLKIARSKKIPVRACARGDMIALDSKTSIQVLHPKKGYIPGNSSLNNGSLVLKLNYMDTSVLFTGDIEEEAEKLLVNDQVDVAADVLKVAHHGSITSSSSGFVEKAMARAAVISVGTNNTFGHPSQHVLDRFLDFKAEIFRTDQDGAVFLSSNGKEYKIRKTVMVR